MSWYRFFPFLLTGIGMFFLTGAFRGSSAPPDRIESPAPPEVARAWDAPAEQRATGILRQAVKRLRNPDCAWLRTDIWLRFHLPEAGYQGQGLFVRAPGSRYRLEVQMHSNAPERSGGYLLMLSDGRDHWQATRTSPDSYSEVKRLRLDELPARRMPTQMMRGPLALLNSLQHHFIWVHSDSRPGEEILTGVWSKPMRKLLASEGKPWPVVLPRVCRVTLRGERRWPARVEMWGPVIEDGVDQLLTEIEFRDPVFGQALPAEECGRLFRFDPGESEVEDETERVKAELTGS